MKSLSHYRNRPGQDCRSLHEEAEPCWGDVFNSSRGFECEGHRGGAYKTPDQERERVALRESARIEEGRKRAEIRARREAEYEASRWFRHVGEWVGVDTGVFEMLTDPMLTMVFSMVGAGLDTGGGSAKVNDAIVRKLGLPAICEVSRRQMSWPPDPYQLKLEVSDADLRVDWSRLSDVDLRLWHGCAAWVMDFSCLDQGVRAAISYLWTASFEEIKRRGAAYAPFLFDMTDSDVAEA